MDESKEDIHIYLLLSVLYRPLWYEQYIHVTHEYITLKYITECTHVFYTFNISEHTHMYCMHVSSKQAFIYNFLVYKTYKEKSTP